MIDAALDAGVTFFDTADIYGNRGGSEEIIGRALGGRRDQVVLATKFGHDLGDGETARGARPYIRRAVEASLRRLQTDRIDLYQYHRPDGVTPIEETLEALHELVHEGVVAAIGSSNFTPANGRGGRAIAAERGLTPFVSQQSQYACSGAGSRTCAARLRTARRLVPPLLPARKRPAHGQVRARRAAPKGPAWPGESPRTEALRRRRGDAKRSASAGLAPSTSRSPASSPSRRRLGDRRRDQPEQVRANVAACAGSRAPRISRSCARSSRARRDRAPPRSSVSTPATAPRRQIGRQVEPIGPGSAQLKIKDPGGAAGEAPVALAIARRTRALLLARGYRVAMTRSSAGYRGGNRERARFCNARGAALMIRIHADGSSDPGVHGISTLVPALRRGWTGDIYGASGRAGRRLQQELVSATGARNLGVVERADLTGFNWADVPAVLVETGFMSNPREAGLLRSAAYQQKLARALTVGAQRFLSR